MNTYSFPLGTDHDDYDASRVTADLRALSGTGKIAGVRNARRHLADLLGFAGSRHGSRAHQ